MLFRLPLDAVAVIVSYLDVKTIFGALTMTMTRALAQRYSNLTSTTASSSSYSDSAVDSESDSDFMNKQALWQETTLHFTQKNVTNSDLLFHLNKLVSLKGIKIERCRLLTDDSMKYICRRFQNVCSIELSVLKISDESLTALAHSKACLTSLSSLSLSSLPRISSVSFHHLARSLHSRLTFLSIKKCTQIDDGALVAIAPACSLLKSMQLEDLTLGFRCFVSLSRVCLHSLSSLTIRSCSSIDALSLSALIDANRETLSFVDISNNEIIIQKSTSSSSNVNSMMHALSQCTALVSLTLSSMRLCDDNIAHFVRGWYSKVRVSTLTMLDISSNSTLTEVALDTLFSPLPLPSGPVSSSSSFSSASSSSFSSSLVVSSLSTLRLRLLSCCLSDSFLCLLPLRCPLLTVLNIDGAHERVTDVGVMTACQGMIKLEEVSCRDCHRLSRSLLSLVSSRSCCRLISDHNSCQNHKSTYSTEDEFEFNGDNDDADDDHEAIY